MAEAHQGDKSRQQRGEQQGWEKSTMAREVTIANAKAKSDHVKIGQHGADGPGHPCPFWHAGAIKPSPHAQGSGCMR
ncbi:MAG: hypothetical protein AUH13_28000 [Acidobacteria bacterium 13_2_20CM_58_27]|nr:MAG: hypothetical protein AUH13_28000 [Acidobacteria bacterium 13_2_20CM_58_27]